MRIQIYATVGSVEKKMKLLDMGLDISQDHIFLSESTDTKDKIMKSTHGKGVDVILSNASGDLLHRYWQPIADFGCFVEIGTSEITNNRTLDMRGFRRSAKFTSFDLDFIGQNHPAVLST